MRRASRKLFLRGLAGLGIPWPTDDAKRGHHENAEIQRNRPAINIPHVDSSVWIDYFNGKKNAAK